MEIIIFITSLLVDPVLLALLKSMKLTTLERSLRVSARPNLVWSYPKMDSSEDKHSQLSRPRQKWHNFHISFDPWHWLSCSSEYGIHWGAIPILPKPFSNTLVLHLSWLDRRRNCRTLVFRQLVLPKANNTWRILLESYVREDLLITSKADHVMGSQARQSRKTTIERRISRLVRHVLFVNCF